MSEPSQVNLGAQAKGEGEPPPPSSTALVDGALVRGQSQPQVYVIFGGARFWVPSVDEFNALGYSWANVHVVPDATVNSIPKVPHDGTLLRERSHAEVYVVHGGKRIWIPTPDALRLMGYSFANVHVIPNGSAQQLPEVRLASGSPTPGSLVWPPDNNIKLFARSTLPGTVRVKSRGHEIRIIELRGWLREVDSYCNDDPGNHDDWHYQLEVDPAWTDALGIDLTQLFTVGDVLSMGIQEDPYSSPYAAFSLPVISMELNGWVPEKRPSEQRPSDWVMQRAECVTPAKAHTYWPFDPLAASGPFDPNRANLNERGPYIRVVGSVVTDQPHMSERAFSTFLIRYLNVSAPPSFSDLGTMNAVKQIWGGGNEADPNHPARWTEIHPPDLIEVLPPKGATETVRGVAVLARNGLVVGDRQTLDFEMAPPPPQPPGKQAAVRELVGPETNFHTIVEGNASLTGANLQIAGGRIYGHVTVQGQAGWGAPGKFMAIYRAFWQ